MTLRTNLYRILWITSNVLQLANALIRYDQLCLLQGGADPAPELTSAKRAKKEAAEKAADKAAEKATKEMHAEVALEEVKPAIKYPIEDLDLKSGNADRDEDSLLARPVPVKDRSVPQDSFEALVMSWQFLNSFR